MDEKISLDAVSHYGDTYAGRVLDSFFATKQKISGNEILSLCNIQQVNLFVVHGLFKSWKDETKNLQSPYFNYAHGEVKEALENLMSVLSKNILIDREHFAPLLRKAVNQTLLVVFDPYDFYSMIVSGDDNRLDVAAFREEIKYLKVNRAPLERMLQKLEEKNVKEIPGNEAFSILDQILEEVSFNPDDVDEYIEKFSAIAALNAESFYTTQVEEEEAAAIVEPPPVPKPSAVPKINAPEPVAKATRPNQTTVPSLNDSLNHHGKPSIADNFQKITRIKERLTINQKFMFTKVLFHGDFELFSQAIDFLDKMDSKKTALRYLEDEHASSWDHDSEEFHEFMEMVEKRFD
jgi:hypothetical protein